MTAYRRGVNIAGAEFGEDHLPGVHGRDFTYNSEDTFRYFCAKGLNLFRVCLRWERLQPELRGPLDPGHTGCLRQNIEWAHKYGGQVIIDIHNFGRYGNFAIDNLYDARMRVSTRDFADLWTRLSAEFRGEPGVYAYGLMCEPHDLGEADWKTVSQTALAAIRDNGDSTLVLVPGDSWSSSERWPEVHGPRGWIADPSGNFAYEAHEYFDADHSGSYALSYDEELARDSGLPSIGRARLRPFTDWCAANGVRGFLGEYGVPDNDPRWLAVLDDFLDALDEAALGGACWAAGEWWGDYPLSVQPRENFTLDRPQLAVLERHTGSSA
ncbi:MAG: glycoside hydrolase family 5 protein [Acidobacteriota bacterium]